MLYVPFLHSLKFFNIIVAVFIYLFIFYQANIAGCWSAYTNIVILLFTLQNYIGEKVGPDEKLPWAQSIIRRGFKGEVWLICSHCTIE